MTMPEMSGDKLAAEILRIRQDMPIIICTGFSEKLDKDVAAALGMSQYIEKPVNKRSLAIAIREVLGKERG